MSPPPPLPPLPACRFRFGAFFRGADTLVEPHDYGGADSEACVDAYAAAGLPLLMVHGQADVTVDPRASAAIFERAAGPKAAVWLADADHQMASRFDELLGVLIEWVPALFAPPPPPEAPPEGLAEGVEPAAHPLAGLTGWGEPCLL